MRMRSSSFVQIACLVLSVAGPFVASSRGAESDEIVPPANGRFADPATQETPDFQRHVVPLMGRVGCNGRSCHGSFQGQSGFRLSLFGYDFGLDHKGLQQRIDSKSPLKSLALLKPSHAVDHEGGQPLPPGTWEHTLFRRWIESGAPPRPAGAAGFLKLEVLPASIRMSREGEQVPLQVIAHWDDGTKEDVTCLSRFQANDPAIAAVSEEGVVMAGDPGDTHVIAFYDNGVAATPVLRPYSDLADDRYPQLVARTRIDELVQDKLRLLGEVPSEVCTDEEFLRRVSLDIAGTLPRPQEVREFVADARPDKRSRKIDELLETPAYAAKWTTFLCDITGNSDAQLNNATAERARASREWYDWIFQRVQANVPYDALMEGVILAVSRQPGETYLDYCERQAAMAGSEPASKYADEPGLTYFWGRGNFQRPEDRAIGFAYTFMGIRLQCAQCHKHPFDEWTQQDFKQFQAFFDRVRFNRLSPVAAAGRGPADVADRREMLAELGLAERLMGNDRRVLADAARDGKLVPASELAVLPPAAANPRRPANRGNPRRPQNRVARLLRDAEPIQLDAFDDPRQPIMDWLRDPETRLFSRAIVNRIWAQYFHRGIVEPTDDLSLANPGSNEPLLDDLARRFIENGYDLKWLHREIAGSDAYQRSWRPNETNRLDDQNFARAVPRRLPAEVLLDAIRTATAGSDERAGLHENLRGRMTTYPGTPQGRQPVAYGLTVFGRSIRSKNCDCDRSPDPSLLQTLYLRNDVDVFAQIDRRDGWLDEVAGTLRPRARQAQAERDRASGPRPQAPPAVRLARLQQALQTARRQGREEQAAQLQQRIRKVREEIANPPPPRPRNADEPFAGAAPRRPDLPPIRIETETARNIIDEAYLRTLGRLPDDEERAAAVEALSGTDGLAGVRDLLWALLNTKEFIVNH
ncbi:MAG: DUF1549 domain-containing protein [Planctomyces sp.]|nr:DUF1549 domain-containing protein [Planctomyces sp.]